jgi:TolB-like protein/Tfp pilus assembly protein PilF
VIFQFGDFTLDDELLELRLGEQLVDVEPQVFRLIAYLIDKRDRVVSKDELISEIWDSRIVSDAALNSRINLARKAVGDNGKSQSVIKTFARRGFRFVAETSEKADRTDARLLGTQDKPSIAILPFKNLSDDAEQQYFSDGITEDIITALSRVRQFFVIARNTTFSNEVQAIDATAIGRELRVGYVLEGSVRKMGNRVRITAQLIDSSNGHHLWADKYDRQIDDIFAVQDEITQTVAGAIGPEIDHAERNRALLAPPENLDAWDFLCRGRWHLYKFDTTNNAEAQEYFRGAIAKDPSFAQAYAALAEAKFVAFFAGLTDTPFDDLQEGFDFARQAVSLDDRDPVAHAILGAVYLVRRDHLSASEALERALTINPSSANGHHWLGLVYAFDGQVDEAVAEQDIATRLSPHDPRLWAFMTVKAYAHLNARRFGQAIQWASRAIRQPNAPRNPYIVQVIAQTHLGHAEDTQQAADTLMKNFPGASISDIQGSIPFKRPEDVELWVEGLRLAGIPE